MTVSILFSSINYLNKTANLVFYPLTGGMINLGVITVPYTYVTSQYIYGEYHLYFPALDKTCIVDITLPPTPTPTVTPTITPTSGATSTPTPTPTPTNTVTPTPTLRGFNTNLDVTTPVDPSDPLTEYTGNTQGLEVFTNLPPPYAVKVEAQQGPGIPNQGNYAEIYFSIPGVGVYYVFVDFGTVFDGSPFQIEVWNSGIKQHVYGAISVLDIGNPDYLLTSGYANTAGTPWLPRGAG